MIHAQCNRMNGATTMILWYDLPRDICGPPVWKTMVRNMERRICGWRLFLIGQGVIYQLLKLGQNFFQPWYFGFFGSTHPFFEKTHSSTCRWHLVSGNACKPTSGWASQRCECYWHERLWSSRCGHVCNHCNRGHCQALPKIGTLGWGNGRC